MQLIVDDLADTLMLEVIVMPTGSAATLQPEEDLDENQVAKALDNFISRNNRLGQEITEGYRFYS